MTHAERCEQSVKRRAEELVEAVKNGRLNASAVEGLLESFVDQPAFYVQDRQRLVAMALRHIGFSSI